MDDFRYSQEEENKRIAKNLEAVAESFGAIKPGMSNQEKLKSIIDLYREKLGVSEKTFPIQTVRSKEIGGKLGRTEKDTSIPGPVVMGKIKTSKEQIGKKGDQAYYDMLSTVIHEMRHARDFQAGTETFKKLSQEKKHFLGGESLPKEYQSPTKQEEEAAIEEEGAIWNYRQAKKEAEEAKKRRGK
jgi:hypothetical protein